MLKEQIEIKRYKNRLSLLQLMCYNDWSGKTLLHIDGNQDCNTLLNEILDTTGICIEYARTGRKSIERILRGEDVDIVFLELRLPDLEGYTVFRIIKRLSPTTPIVAFTTNVWNNEMQNCIDAGFDFFIGKPADIGMYFYVLGEVLG